MQTSPINNEGNKNQKEKLKKSLIALGILGAVGIGAYAIYRGNITKLKDIEFNKGFAKLKNSNEGFTGTVKDKLKNGDKITLTYKDGVLQSSTRKGSVNFTKTYETVNGEKIVKTTKNGVTTESNITALAKGANKTKLRSVEKLGNGRIRVVFQRGKNISQPIELPEYLYHVTSAKAFDQIQQSGALKISQTEQLKGLYLLDGQNFIDRYATTPVDGGQIDLLSAIFRQAARSDSKVPLDKTEYSVIRIPTEDLLKTGKIRVRTQEDFFTYQRKILDISKKTGKKYNLRNLCDDAKRADFRKTVIAKGIMTESETDKFISDMTRAVHFGYGLGDVSKLEAGHSVEYIFNHEIKLSEYPNIAVHKVKAADCITPGGAKVKFDPTRTAKIFDPSGFAPIGK